MVIVSLCSPAPRAHDGCVAAIADRKLLFSLESEKDSFRRYSVLEASSVLELTMRLDRTPDIVAIGGGGKDHSETQRGSKQSNREHCPVDQHGILHRFPSRERPIWRLSPPRASRRSSQLRVTACDSSCAAIRLDSSRLLDGARYVPSASGACRRRARGLRFGSRICTLGGLRRRHRIRK